MAKFNAEGLKPERFAVYGEHRKRAMETCTMRWMLVERKPDVVYAGRPDLYLAKDGAETNDCDRALTFETREAAEAHRRNLHHPYDWVAISTPR